MSDPHPPPPANEREDSLTVEVGSWFKAHATGAGVIAIPAILVIFALLVFAGVL